MLRLRNPLFEVIGLRDSWWGTWKMNHKPGSDPLHIGYEKVNVVVIKSNSEHSCYEKDIRLPLSFINNSHTSLLMVKHSVFTPPLPNKPSGRKEIQSKLMTCPTPILFLITSTQIYEGL